MDFLKLAAGSAMIDKGTDVQLPFVGAAPDLGAYEYGASTGGVGSGGSVASGGTQGSAATGGTTAATSTAEAGAVGCSCRLAGAQTRSYPALLALLIFALRLRKRR